MRLPFLMGADGDRKLDRHIRSNDASLSVLPLPD